MASPDDHEQTEYKIVLIGDSCSSGMSSLAYQLSELGTQLKSDSKVAGTRIKHVIDGIPAVIEIIQVHEANSDEYIKSGDGFLLIYSNDSRESFEAAKQYHSKILKIKNRSAFPMLLVSPIYYSLLIVDHEEGSRLAKRLKIGFMEWIVFIPRTGETEKCLFEIVRSIRKSKC